MQGCQLVRDLLVTSVVPCHPNYTRSEGSLNDPHRDVQTCSAGTDDSHGRFYVGAVGGMATGVSDEFNGDKLDRAKWATRYLYQNETMDHFNDENQRYGDGHVVADGVLNLIAKKMPGSVSLYESAMIRSHRTFYYGYYEARVFLPDAKGIWPAFWLEADYDIDGKTWHPPEIDIFEFVINGVEDKANSLHSNTAGPWSEKSYTYVDRNFLLKFQNMYGSEDLNLGWHVAGFVWAPDRISLFWDGKLIYTRNYQWLRKDETRSAGACRLNFAVGGSNGRAAMALRKLRFRKPSRSTICAFVSTRRPSAAARQCGPSELTPDPKQFGYSAPFNDTAKPAFLGVQQSEWQAEAQRRRPRVKHRDKLDVEIPLKIPEDYPSDRTLQLTVYDRRRAPSWRPPIPSCRSRPTKASRRSAPSPWPRCLPCSVPEIAFCSAG